MNLWSLIPSKGSVDFTIWPRHEMANLMAMEGQMIATTILFETQSEN